MDCAYATVVRTDEHAGTFWAASASHPESRDMCTNEGHKSLTTNTTNARHIAIPPMSAPPDIAKGVLLKKPRRQSCFTQFPYIVNRPSHCREI